MDHPVQQPSVVPSSIDTDTDPNLDPSPDEWPISRSSLDVMNTLAQETEGVNWAGVEFAEGLPESLHQQIVDYYSLISKPWKKGSPPFVNATKKTEDDVCIHVPSGEVLDVFVRPFDDKRPNDAEQISTSSKIKIIWVTSKQSKVSFILSFGKTGPYNGVRGAYFHAWLGLDGPRVEYNSWQTVNDGGFEKEALYHFRKAAAQEIPASPTSPQLDDEGNAHWNSPAGEHILNTTRFRFHPFFSQQGRERSFNVCSTAFNLWGHARAADVFRKFPREAEVLDVSVMGRRSQCSTKLSGQDRDQDIERAYAVFLRNLVQLAEEEELRNKVYVVDVKDQRREE